MNKVIVAGLALALVLMGCSEDSKSVAGGASEETRGLASLNNITLSGRAYYAPGIPNDGTGPSDDISVSTPLNVFSQSGEVTLTELDSVTLEPLDDSLITTPLCVAEEDSLTGEIHTCNGAELGGGGVILFENISLRSPIVLLEAVSGAISLKAIVDVRDTGAFIIDGLTHLASYRTKKLVGSGMSFTSAKNQVEEEIGNMFGFDDSSDRLLQRDAFNEGVQYSVLEQLKEEFGETGTNAGFSQSAKDSLRHGVFLSYVWDVLWFSPKAFEKLGDSSALFYQECLKKKNYYAKLLANVFGSGECASAGEASFFDVGDDIVGLKCLSGSWDLVNKKIGGANVDHSFGTITDSRDGKEYKTVTIDLDGTSQTWMAENLNYATETSTCYRGDSLYCDAYGRIYSFVPENAENVDWNGVIDSLDFDICPDGWRLPRFEDWDTLFTFVKNRFDVLPDFEMELLLSSYGNPVGFGLEFASFVRGEPGKYRAAFGGPGSYLFAPAPTPEGIRDYVDGDFVGAIQTEVSIIGKQFHRAYINVKRRYAMPSEGFVRCVKN